MVVTLEDKSTLIIAHMTSTLLSPIHFSKNHKVVCTGSIKIADVYRCIYHILLNDKVMYAKYAAE